MPPNTDTNKDKQTFCQYVLNTMSAADFNTLPSQLGVSQRMTTMRLTHPEKMKLEMIEPLARMLKVSVKFLIEEFDAGEETLSAKEYKELTKSPVSELEISPSKLETSPSELETGRKNKVPETD